MIFKSFAPNQKAGATQAGELTPENSKAKVHEPATKPAGHALRSWPFNRDGTGISGTKGSVTLQHRLVYPETEPTPVKIEAEEACEFCSAKLSEQHRHLLDVSRRTIVCACDACALRFENSIQSRFKLIPQDTSALPDFRLTGILWENLNLPINVVFISYNRLAGRPTAIYPGPNGAAETPITVEDWQAILADNPELEDLKPDVEALLIDRTGETAGYFRAPIDVCYELVRLIRKHWRGFAGGDRVWLEIETFFARLHEQTDRALRRNLPLNEVCHA